MEGPRRNRLPWTRLVAEGVVIVVSILLAFFVDTSWDRYQERGEERGYLVSLQGEFGAASSLLEASLQSRTIASDRVLNLILQAQGAEPAPEDSLFLWSAALSQQLEFDPPRAVLDELVSSGETGLIRSDQLRLALARYRSLLQTQSHRDDQAWAIWENRAQPLLEGRIPRTDRLIRGSFGAMRTVPFGLSRHEADWAGVLSDPVFEDVLAERWMRLQLAAAALQQVQAQVREIAEMIERSLTEN